MTDSNLFPPALSFSNAREGQRLFERHKRILTPNLQWIRGKPILRLASNNGRWVWAALNAGAAFVTGVEGRDDCVVDAKRNLMELGFQDRSRMVCSDIFDFLFQGNPND